MIQEMLGEQDRSLSPIQNIFKNRGMDYHVDAIKKQLYPDIDCLNSLDTIENLKEGVAMLIRHIKANNKVLLVIDEDCDGYTSSAFLLNYLNKLFPHFVQSNIKYVVHPNKAHGIPTNLITDEKLIIAPDASSNEYDIHKELAEKGIDVLIIDHHEAPKFSEYACVINNQIGNYPNKSLSGVGMVWKFCSQVDKIMNVNYCDNLLDLVALGVIGDMMDLRPLETRWVVENGFKILYNPFLQAMAVKQEYQVKDRLNPFRAAFYIVPGINSVTRIGTVEEKRLLFESMLDFKAFEKIPSTKRGHKEGELETKLEQSVRNCTNIKNKQDRLKLEMAGQIDKIIKEKNLLDNKLLVIKVKKPINTGLTGLIANQIANKYMRPTLILNRRDQTGEITYEGSGRNFSNSPIDNFRGFLEDTGLVMYAQGHASAFGCGIAESNFDAFIQKTNEILKDFDLQNKYNVDIIYEANNLNSFDILDISDYENIWGQEIPEPLIAVKKVLINNENIRLYGSGARTVLKIETPSGLSFVKFGVLEEEYQSLLPRTEYGYTSIDVIGTCSKNDYDQSAQIKIKDYEIVDRGDYLF